MGQVQAGVSKPGTVVPLASDNAASEVKCIELHHEIVSKAPPGGNVGFGVKNMSVKAFLCGDVAGGTKMTHRWKHLASWLRGLS